MLQIRRQCEFGKAANAVMSGAASTRRSPTSGNWRASLSAIEASCSCTASVSGWAKMVRIAAATISCEPLGTRERTLRMKCTRQRCQAAPAITAPMAALRPSWASEITSRTPVSPRARRLLRNWVQNAPSSESPTERPSTSRPPSERTPVAITTALATTCGPWWALR